ncbi:MAG: amidohydrolase family protein [Steroidobacteraceae bacterium]
MMLRALLAALLLPALLPRAGAAELPLQPARHIDIDTDEGTWLSPDPSPDGRWIVFELLGDVYRMPAGGGEAQALTHGMAMDTQPVYSPDGREIAFLSDASGAENLWVMAADGSAARAITHHEEDSVFASPAWSADGRSLYVSRYRAETNGFELWRVARDSGEETLLIPIKATPDQPRDQWSNVLGAAPTADGRFLYFARHTGADEFEQLPEWDIVRRELATGRDEVIVSAPRSPRPDLLLGTAFRPAISHDGRWLAYGTRDRGLSGLKLLDLETHRERWLRYPVQQDESQASGWRDLLPRHAFSQDDRRLIATVDGKVVSLDLASGESTVLPFHVHQSLPLGPSTRQDIREDTGPVRARLMQYPALSPDGRTLAFSTLGSLYTLRLDAPSHPRRLGAGFQPQWSPDGRWLTFVTWTAATAGDVRVMPATGGESMRVSASSDYYTSPVFTPDGRQILALRSSNAVRMHSYMEYGTLRQSELLRWTLPADLVTLPAHPPAVAMVARGSFGGTPHFATDPGVVFLLGAGGLHAMRLDGSDDHLVANVTGPNWYFAEGRASADDLRISPDGRWLLAQLWQQLHLFALPPPGATLDIDGADPSHRQLTKQGADFFSWTAGGYGIAWSLGSSLYQLPLPQRDSRPAEPRRIDAVVELPRAHARGSLLLRGATLITERGDEVIPDADLLVVDDRIAALGPRGKVRVPRDATIRSVAGKWIVPGFIDTHDHVADVRRGILDFDSWGPLANLAYGVTTAFDPSTLSIDMLAYQDAVDAGLMTGSRIASTGPAVFSFNEFRSYDQVLEVLSRYRDAYRLRNIKMYRSGNRRVRQWIAQAALALGLQPTTEGALSMKLDESQIIDGYAGNEHALTAVPLYRDMLQLLAGSGVAWNATLQITNGGAEGQDYFIVRDHPADDPKLNRFAPRFVVDMKTRTRTWREPAEYLFPRIAASAAAAQRLGAVIGIGSHGEMPGLGVHWELQAHVMGGMTPAEALRAGTIGSATAIGRNAEFGSLAPGKFADLVILDRDPTLDIANTLAIHAVMLGGRLRDGRTLDERWPAVRPLPRRWYCDDRPPGTADPCTDQRPLARMR